jgi:hypothetical protein
VSHIKQCNFKILYFIQIQYLQTKMGKKLPFLIKSVLIKPVSFQFQYEFALDIYTVIINKALILVS